MDINKIKTVFDIIPLHFVVLACLCGISTMGCGYWPPTESLEAERRRTLETQEAIKLSPSLQEIDRICTSIPKPDDAKLILMRKNIRNSSEFLVYGYLTDKTYEQVKRFYTDYYVSNDWSDVEEMKGLKTNEISSTKDGIKTTIGYAKVHSGVNFSFMCTRLGEKSD